ncbi:hypothetical protein HY501_01700 [Candidatus Woesearchaeota archaeon]|nr:hypothetical protein [Candidatus Woesearchaeota archaeon]
MLVRKPKVRTFTMGWRNRILAAAASLVLSMGACEDTKTYRYPTFPYGRANLAPDEIEEYVTEKVEDVDYEAYIPKLKVKLPDLYDLKGSRDDFALALEPYFALLLDHSRVFYPISLNLYHHRDHLFYQALYKLNGGRPFYFDKTLYIEKSDLTLPFLAHEYGHSADPYLSILKWVSDDAHELRAEILAETFKCSFGERLAREYFLEEGRRIFTDCRSNFSEMINEKGLEDFLSKSTFIHVDMVITSLYGSDAFSSLEEIYLFTRSHGQDSFFSLVRSLLSAEAFGTLFERGHKKFHAVESEVCKRIDSGYCEILLKPRR